LRSGFRLPGPANDKPAPPITAATNLAYSSEPDPGGLPKAIVDEVELLSGGSYGRLSYYSDIYVVDGGRAGLPRDVWTSYWGTPSARGNVLRLRLGDMTLPLPVDPEALRETENHYAVFDQTAGSNPFNFFDVHLGVDVAFGNPNRGLDAHVLVLRPHDPQWPLPQRGVDAMEYAQWLTPNVSLSAYRYNGTRLLGGPDDAFLRYGFGASATCARLTANAVLQNGSDGNADGMGRFVRAAGGFLQLRWEFSPALDLVGRYDGTQDTTGSFLRSATFALNRRVARNARLTIEDVITHVPFTKHTFNAGLYYSY
jgi:hypothetical protein